MRISLFHTVLVSTLLVGGSLASVACTTEESAGADGAAGDAGAAGSAGSGGSTAGSGGSTAGSGGSTAGAGGSTAGSGGSTAGSGGSTAGSGGSTAGSGGSAAGSGGSTGGSGGSTGGSGGGTTDGAYLRFAHLAPIASSIPKNSLDVCLDAKGGDFSQASPIFAALGDSGQFYWPAVTIWLEVDAIDLDVRFVKAGAADCKTAVTSGGAPLGGNIGTLAKGSSSTLIVYDEDNQGQGKALKLALQSSSNGSGSNAKFTFFSAYTNLSSKGSDFLTAGGTELKVGVGKFQGAEADVAPFNDKVASWKTGSTAADKALAITMDAVDAKAGGSYSAFASGVNEFGDKANKLNPWVIVCDNSSTNPGFGTKVLADCKYSQAF